MGLRQPRRAAEQRARSLLRSTLDPEQRRDLRAFDGFRIRDGRWLYWVRIGFAPLCADLTNGRLYAFCVAPDEFGEMPPEDVALTFALWIRGGRGEFRARANIMHNLPLPRFKTEEDLVLHVASRVPTTAVPLPRRRRPPARPERPVGPPPVPDEIAAANARAIARGLRVRYLRVLLAGARAPLDDRALERIAEQWRPTRR